MLSTHSAPACGGWQRNWIHRGAPRPANPVTCFPPGKVVAPATKGGMHFLARRAVVWFYTNWRLLSFRGALQQPSRQRRVKLKSLKNLRPSGPSTLKPHRGLSIRRRGLWWRPSGADLKKGARLTAGCVGGLYPTGKTTHYDLCIALLRGRRRDQSLNEPMHPRPLPTGGIIGNILIMYKN